MPCGVASASSRRSGDLANVVMSLPFVSVNSCTPTSVRSAHDGVNRERCDAEYVATRVTSERRRVHARTVSVVADGRSRAERKEATRQRLLDVTLQWIANRSLDSISLREVARAAGIVPTAFYRHFDSMDQLGVELVDDCMRSLRQMIRDARRGVA